MPLLWIIAWSLAAPPPSSGARLLDHVLADVDGVVITQSEVYAEARFVLARARGPEAALATPLDGELMSAILGSLVQRALILAELRRLQLARVAEGDVDKALIAVTRAVFGGEAAQRHRFCELAGLGPPKDADQMLRNILRQELATERFIDVRVRTALVVEDVELRRCYAAVKDHFKGLSFDQVRPRLRLRLTEQRELVALRRLIQQLQGKAKVRILGPLKPAELEEEDDAPFSCPLEGA